MNAQMNDDFPRGDEPQYLGSMTETTIDIGKLAGALAKAQGSITGALKDSSNPFFKSKYADLAACWDACRKPLSENGLAVIQTTEIRADFVTIVTLLAHESGEWIRSRLPMKPKDFSPQAVGSTMTYARRYALAAMVGLAQVDDDAESAQHRGTEPARPDPKLVKEYAKRLQEALDVGLDQAVLDIHNEIVEDEVFYREAWSHIPSGARRAIKEVIARAKGETNGKAA
ncbi:MAG TPA: ERF family protein [Nitrospiraceae bacterium]|nr:ERF family protein [Nitrospiraceae bacterium]